LGTSGNFSRLAASKPVSHRCGWNAVELDWPPPHRVAGLLLEGMVLVRVADGVENSAVDDIFGEHAQTGAQRGVEQSQIDPHRRTISTPGRAGSSQEGRTPLEPEPWVAVIA
jgi:hypothetical protein